MYMRRFASRTYVSPSLWGGWRGIVLLAGPPAQCRPARVQTAPLTARNTIVCLFRARQIPSKANSRKLEPRGRPVPNGWTSRTPPIFTPYHCRQPTELDCCTRLAACTSTTHQWRVLCRRGCIVASPPDRVPLATPAGGACVSVVLSAAATGQSCRRRPVPGSASCPVRLLSADRLRQRSHLPNARWPGCGGTVWPTAVRQRPEIV